MRLGLARALLRAKNSEEAATLFAQMEAVPRLREEAQAAQVQAYREAAKPEKAIEVLERMIAPEIRTTVQAGGAIMLAQLYADKKERESRGAAPKAGGEDGAHRKPRGANGVAVKLGDDFLTARQFTEALACYRAVRSREDFGPALLLRMERAFYDGEKRWEAMVVYDRVRTRYPAAKERETALFGMIIASAEVGQAKMCQRFCAQYMEEFKDGPNTGTSAT